MKQPELGSECGSERPAEPSLAGAPAGVGSERGGWAWEMEMGLLTNPLILRQLVTLLAMTGLLMSGLLSFLFAVQGEWGSIPMVLLITLAAVGSVALLMVLVIVLFFGNRFRVRFAVHEQGIEWAVVDRRARAGNRLAALLGMLGGSPSAAGAGLMGMAREHESYSWRGFAGASYHPRWHGIALRNRWRTVAFLACTPGNYPQVAAYVHEHISAPAAGHAAAGRSPLPRLLGRSLLVVLASLPVFLLPYPFELDLLLPLIMLCFALATIWLVHLFGWVVIAAALWIAAEILHIALRTRESIFPWRGSYRTFEVLDSGDWLALALAAAGLAYLVVFSWRAARGHLPAALIEDAELED